MQIELWFACRQCEKRQVIRTNTADFGINDSWAEFMGPGVVTPIATRPVVLPLLCLKCGHTSGIVDLGYRAS